MIQKSKAVSDHTQYNEQRVKKTPAYAKRQEGVDRRTIESCGASPKLERITYDSCNTRNQKQAY